MNAIHVKAPSNDRDDVAFLSHREPLPISNITAKQAFSTPHFVGHNNNLSHIVHVRVVDVETQRLANVVLHQIVQVSFASHNTIRCSNDIVRVRAKSSGLRWGSMSNVLHRDEERLLRVLVRGKRTSAICLALVRLTKMCQTTSFAASNMQNRILHPRRPPVPSPHFLVASISIPVVDVKRLSFDDHLDTDRHKLTSSFLLSCRVDVEGHSLVFVGCQDLVDLIF